MHRYRLPATGAVAALALMSILGAAIHRSVSAPKVRAAAAGSEHGSAAHAHLYTNGAYGGDVRLKSLSGDLYNRQVLEFFFILKAKADAEAKAKADAEAQAKAAAAQRARASRGVQTAAPRPAASASGHACGGDLPSCCIMMRESKGDPTAVNRSSGAAGKWQFMPGTWAGYGGYSSAAQAPESVQDARAREVWAGGSGAGNWAGSGC